MCEILLIPRRRGARLYHRHTAAMRHGGGARPPGPLPSSLPASPARARPPGAGRPRRRRAQGRVRRGRARARSGGPRAFLQHSIGYAGGGAPALTAAERRARRPRPCPRAGAGAGAPRSRRRGLLSAAATHGLQRFTKARGSKPSRATTVLHSAPLPTPARTHSRAAGPAQTPFRVSPDPAAPHARVAAGRRARSGGARSWCAAVPCPSLVPPMRPCVSPSPFGQ